MTIQVLRDIELSREGVRIKAGAVLNVPDAMGAALIRKGQARTREAPGPAETKEIDIDIPDPVPYARIPAPPVNERNLVPGAYSDQDNFIRDLVTVTPETGGPYGWAAYPGYINPLPPITPSGSASDRPPLLTLDQIKMHLKIDADQTDEDTLLQQYEMAARLHAENVLRYTIDDPATVGENIKQACLFLVAHFYRNREAVSIGKTSEGVQMPLGFMVILYAERDYPVY